MSSESAAAAETERLDRLETLSPGGDQGAEMEAPELLRLQVGAGLHSSGHKAPIMVPHGV